MAAITTAVALGVAAAGAGVSAYGAMGSAKAGKEQAGYSMNVAHLEQQQDELRAKAMEANAARQEIEIVRNAQRARAMALSAATNQGAAYGDSSGLLGGQAEISGQENYNKAGIQNSLMQGREMFGLNAQISQNRIGMAQAGGKLATSQGWSSFGGSLMQASSAAGRLGGGFGGGGQSSMSFTDFGTGQGAWPMFR